MGEEFIKHGWYLGWVDIELNERTELGQGLDVSLQIGRMDQARFGGQNKSLQLLVHRPPV